MSHHRAEGFLDTPQQACIKYAHPIERRAAIPVNSSTSLASQIPPMPAQGDFSTTPAPGLVADLMRSHFSGTLRVERAGMVKVLYLSNGDLACASSNAEEDRLGNLLVRHGRLSADQLAHAQAKKPERATIGNILVELGFITSAELLWGARRQVEEILGDLVGWREGTYLLRDMPLSKEVVNLAMPGRTLLVRALLQLPDRELVLERLGTLETTLLRQPSFDEIARGLDFGFVVDDLLTQIDGKKTVREMCGASGLDDFQACKVLYTLTVLGALGHGATPARELIFVEGELQNGEELPRANESKARRSWLRPVREPSRRQPSVPNGSTGPAAPEKGKEAPAQQAPAPAAGTAGPDPAPVRHRRPSRTALWAAALAILLLAIGASLYYATYVRPTLTPDDAEEARLVAALVEELEASGEIEPGTPAASSRASVIPGVLDSGGGLPEGTPPPPPAGGEGTSETLPSGIDIISDPEPAKNPPSEQPGIRVPRAPRKESPSLENTAPLTMLSRDGNFRSAQNLVRKGRILEAAESFHRALSVQKAGTHAIQLLLACQGSTVEKAFARAPDRTLYFVTTTYRGQTCYRLFDGLYASAAEARRDLDKIPATFREDGNRPVIVRVPRR